MEIVLLMTSARAFTLVRPKPFPVNDRKLTFPTWSMVPFTGNEDYRMARGFPGGESHQVVVTSDVKVSKRFLINGSYRFDIRKEPGNARFDPPNNVFTLEVRVLM